MGIEKVDLKLENGQKAIPFKGHASTPRVRLDAPKDTVSFTGGPSSLLDSAKMMAEGLIPKHRKWIDVMESAKWLKGEIGGILLTAFGTGLVAPIFIGFNPFVKAPKDATPEQKRDVVNTKLYTAMRQPISAVLAILFQASILKYIDKGLDKIFNNEAYSQNVRLNTDQSILNTETYIKEIAKKRLAERKVKNPSFIAGMFSKNARVERAVYNEKLKKEIEKEQKAKIDEVVAQFEKDNKILVNKSAKRYVDGETMADVISRQVDSYIEDAKKLVKEDREISKYAQKAKLLTDNEQYFRELAASLPIDDINKVQVKELITQVLPYKEIKNAKDKELLLDLIKEADKNIDTLIKNIGEGNPEVKAILEELKGQLDLNPKAPKAGRFVELCETQAENSRKELKTLYKQLTEEVKVRIAKETDPELQKELKQILMKSEDLRANRVSRILQRIESIKELCGPEGYEYNRYKNVMLNKRKVVSDRIVDLETCKDQIKKMGKLDENGVKTMLEKIAKVLTFDEGDALAAPVLKDTDVFGKDLGEISKKLYKDVTKVYKKLVQDSYKSVTQNSKMIIGAVITLPITCTALNWLYPRIMELCFPKLAGVKKAQTQPQAPKNGGDK